MRVIEGIKCHRDTEAQNCSGDGERNGRNEFHFGRFSWWSGIFYGSLAASSNAIEITKKGARGGKHPTQNRTTRLHQNLAHENNKKCHSMIDQKKKCRQCSSKKKTKPIMTVSQATFIAFATLRMFNVGTTKGKQAHTAEETTRSHSDANHTRDKVRWC